MVWLTVCRRHLLILPPSINELAQKMSAEKLYNLSLSEKESIKKELLSNFQSNISVQGSCHLWKLDLLSKYPRKWVAPLKTQIPVHALYSFLFKSSLPRKDRDEELSHRCGNARCVNIYHLTVEPHAINNERKKCHGTATLKKGEERPTKCIGHTRETDLIPRLPCVMHTKREWVGDGYLQTHFEF